MIPIEPTNVEAFEESKTDDFEARPGDNVEQTQSESEKLESKGSMNIENEPHVYQYDLNPPVPQI